jgi:predicted lipid-binding transport protein (Tim44 family)
MNVLAPAPNDETYMSASFDYTTIVFAVLALFVLFKLKSVLGTPPRNERPQAGATSRQLDQPGPAKSPDNSRSNSEPTPYQPWQSVADQKTWAGLDDIKRADPSFAIDSFLSGCRKAYEIIIGAFASGDRAALKTLLAPDVFEGFASAIAARDLAGEKTETTIVSIEKSSIEQALMKGDAAQITIRFSSKLISVTRDKSGNIVSGDSDQIVNIIDIWTFSRDVKDRDPNWKLISTETGH